MTVAAAFWASNVIAENCDRACVEGLLDQYPYNIVDETDLKEATAKPQQYSA
jgi:hypothetical protein